MVFSSISFLFVFLPLLLAVYFLLPARLREGRNLVLLLFSLFFFGFLTQKIQHNTSDYQYD